MTARTFNELFDPPIPRLSLAKTAGGWIVWDERCRYYVLSPSPLDVCLRFVAAMVAKGHATVDDGSVERATWEATQEHSWRVPQSLALGGASTPAGDSPDRRTEGVPAPEAGAKTNVYPLFHGQLDETA